LNLRLLQKHWNFFGKTDPLWAVLTHPEKKNSGWDAEEFFQTGVSEVNAALQYVESLHPLPSKKRALDFGCGVGRLTQALALHFEQVDGVDISPAMIEHARAYNKHGSRCEYLHNQRSDLSILPSNRFDFIYSNITLQHMSPRYSKRYLREFLRLLTSNGVLLFQLPSQRSGKFASVRSLPRRLYHHVLYPSAPFMDMRGIRKDKVVRWLTKHGGKVLDFIPDRSGGPEWDGFRYLVARAAPSALVPPTTRTTD
jgi:ubiquinone/menaquinone biosynthesis C-methylase UbiE